MNMEKTINHNSSDPITNKIQIAVACHKPSVLPDNPLFVPVQVGAANATKRMKGMRYDDESENISAKNPYYCELTAQYWAWKNLDADYYGLCHYRRFLCFANIAMLPRNERRQVEAYAIDAFNVRRFGLADAEQMRAVIEANDIVCGEAQKVSSLFTPRGNQKTVYKHWTAHDRALIKKEDLDLMLEILDRSDPEVGKSAREYMNGCFFTGFNCFVMRKELFRKMCELEFRVLAELEDKTDLTTYSQNLARIYGFMGEIISSAYIYHIERQKRYRVKHMPLVYFHFTDVIPDYKPVSIDQASAIPVLFMHGDRPDFLFATAWKTFLNHTEPAYSYDVMIETKPMRPQIKKVISDMAASYPNISVRYLDHILIQNQIRERSEIQSEKSGNYPALPFVPWILPHYSKCLVFDSQVLFAAAVTALWGTNLNGAVFGAPLDAYMQAKCNDVFEETAYTPLKKVMKDPYRYFSTAATVWDFQKYRSLFSREKIAAVCRKVKKANVTGAGLCDAELIINVICEGRVKILPQRWNVWFDSGSNLKSTLPNAPASLYKALLEARKDPAVVRYEEWDPWHTEADEVGILFWQSVRDTSFYETYLSYLIKCLQFPNAGTKNRPHSTIAGGIQCVKDHGLAYTLHYIPKRLAHT